MFTHTLKKKMMTSSWPTKGINLTLLTNWLARQSDYLTCKHLNAPSKNTIQYIYISQYILERIKHLTLNLNIINYNVIVPSMVPPAF